MATRHPNIWRFLEKLRSEQREIEQQIVQIRGGHTRIRGPLRKTYVEQNRIIEEIVRNYGDILRETIWKHTYVPLLTV